MENISRIKFSFDKPVSLKYLYDRNNEMEKLFQNTTIFILGPLGIGKTSLLKSYIIKEKCKTIWIDGAKVKSFNNFIATIRREYKNLLKKINNNEKISFFQQEKVSILEIKNFQDKSDKFTFLSNFFEQLSSIGIENICFVIDNFTEMRQIGTPFNEISRAIYWAAKKKELKIFLSSSELGYAKEILEKKDLPFQKAFFTLMIKPFNQEESTLFISKGLEQYGVACPKKYIGDAYYVAEGFPIWLSLIGLRMLEGKCIPEGIYTDKRAQAFWVERLSRLSNKERYILRLIAKGKNFKIAGPHSRRVLKSLIRKGYVISNHNEQIVDPILNFLLKEEYI